MKKEKSACNRPSLAQGFLHGILSFLDILNARASAIVVVIELMEGAKVSTKIERPGMSIFLHAVQHCTRLPIFLFSNVNDMLQFCIGSPERNYLSSILSL